MAEKKELSFREMLAKREELVARQQELDNLIAEAQQGEFEAFLDRIEEEAAEFGALGDSLVAALKPLRKKAGKSRGSGSALAPKYRHPETGETWSGRGKPAGWIAPYPKEEREQFRIKEDGSVAAGAKGESKGSGAKKHPRETLLTRNDPN